MFGAIFNHRLVAGLARHLPPGAPAHQRGPHRRASRSRDAGPATRGGYVQAYSSALHTVFLAAVPFVVVAFTLTLLLPKIPLCATSRAPGAANTHAMPSLRSSLDEIARALSVLAGREGKSRLYERIMSRVGADQDPVDTWLPYHLARVGPASVHDLARRLHRPAENVEARLNRLVRDGLIVATTGQFRPTAVGQALVDQVRAAEHDTLAELLWIGHTSNVTSWPTCSTDSSTTYSVIRTMDGRSAALNATHRYLGMADKPRPTLSTGVVRRRLVGLR